MSVTIKDVAKRAGVSPTVVSRVLHNRAQGIRVSEATAARVREAAADLGYTLNAVARAFRERTTMTLAVAHEGTMQRPRFSGLPPYFAAMFDGVVDAAFELGYSITLCPRLLGDQPNKALTDARFDGVLWYSSFVEDVDEEHIRRLEQPTVVLHAESAPVPAVVCDNNLGIRLALEHLRNLGHRRVDFLTWGPEMRGEALLRRAAYQLHAESMGLLGNMVDLRPDASGGDQWLGSAGRANACLAEGDHLAIAVLRRAQALGIDVPRQLSIVGFDSLPTCDWTVPTLTSVHQPLYEIGSTACRKLVALIHGESVEPLTVLPCTLDVRASTAEA